MLTGGIFISLYNLANLARNMMPTIRCSLLFLLSCAAMPGQADAHSDSLMRTPGVALNMLQNMPPDVETAKPPDAFKRYPGLPRLALPRDNPAEPGLMPGLMPGSIFGLSAALRAPQISTGKQALSLAGLSELLYLAAGITARREGVNYRAAPSAGGLFPSELYVLVRDSGIQGLGAGLYHYDAEHQRLDVLHSGMTKHATPLFSTEAAAGAKTLLVLTSVLSRTAYKYHERAYRLSLADAGHVLENLRLAAHQAGLQASLLAQFDEAITAKILGIDGKQETVLAMMALRRATASGNDQPLAGLADKSMPESASPFSPASPELILPAPTPALQGVYHSITHRRSKRNYLPQPVPLATLSSMLADIAQAPQLSGLIRIDLVVSRVTGLAPGVYRYHRSRSQHALQPVRSGDLAAQAQSAALAQDVIGNAAVVLVLSGDRERILAQGPLGYRHLYLEAGMLSERWLLSATARGLAACPVGAFYDDQAAVLIGADPERHQVLHFAALGLAAE